MLEETPANSSGADVGEAPRAKELRQQAEGKLEALKTELTLANGQITPQLEASMKEILDLMEQAEGLDARRREALSQLPAQSAGEVALDGTTEWDKKMDATHGVDENRPLSAAGRVNN